MDSVVCLACNTIQKNYKGLARHARMRHGLSAQDYYDAYLKKSVDDGVCLECGKPARFISIREGYAPFCGVKCSNKNQAKNDVTRETWRNFSEEKLADIKFKTRQTLEERYGDPHYGLYGSDSFKAKLKNKYGDEHYSNHEKARQTCLERYGVEYNFQMPGFKEHAAQAKISKYGCQQNLEKMRETNRMKYGADYFAQTPEFRDKLRASRIRNYGSIKNAYKHIRQKSCETLYNRYGDPNYNNKDKAVQTRIDKSKQFAADNNATPVPELIAKYGQGWYVTLDNINYLRMGDHYLFVKNEDIPKIEDYASTYHYITPQISGPEKDVLSYVKSIYDGEIITNDKTIIKGLTGRPVELDIYIPDKNLAIEFNGSFYHSLNMGVSRNYHRHKTESCEALGIRLIHVFEDQWINSKDICKSIISSALGKSARSIYARNCTVRPVSDKTEEESFLTANHIQGYIPSSACWGLYYNDELVQLASFGRSRFESDKIELYRMCTAKFTHVVGGFSKLIKNCGYSNITTYVDRSLFDGSGYKAVGFKKVKDGVPGYFYLNGLKRYNRMHFQKSKLKDKLNKFDPNLSEIENMMLNGYLVVYDSGSDKYEYKEENNVNG